MNYLDLIIIYLACGSPFGVYYFFNNRQTQKSIWLKSIFAVFLWTPYAIKLLQTKVTEKLNENKLIFKSDKINSLQKEFEQYLPSNNIEISLFELREIIERYAGLTLICFETNSVPAKHELEIYRLQGIKNAEISALCLNRRNYKRLKTHQTKARMDFIESLRILLRTNSEIKKLGNHSLEFVRILNDEKARTSINELFEESRQTVPKPTVKHLEKEIWKPQEQKQSKEKQISIPMQTMKMTANIPKKD